MSTDNRFEYHKYLSKIAANDVEFLKKKDRSYGASWKNNGRSAWFMVKRMIDRLVEMMARPKEPTEYGFNLQNIEDAIDVLRRTDQRDPVRFHGTNAAMAAALEHVAKCHVAEDLLGILYEESRTREAPENEAPDGYVLSVVRDLRRYCLLVEAEILFRLGVPESRTAEARPTSKSPLFAAPAEDSNRHAERKPGKKINPPWTVDGKWRFENGYGDSSGRADQFNQWWEPNLNGNWRLRPYVVCCDLPPVQVSDLYALVTNSDNASGQYVIDVTKCPSSLRTVYPKFHMECNLKELNDQRPDWSNLLYYKVSGDDKWRVKPGCEAWASW